MFLAASILAHAKKIAIDRIRATPERRGRDALTADCGQPLSSLQKRENQNSTGIQKLRLARKALLTRATVEVPRLEQKALRQNAVSS